MPTFTKPIPPEKPDVGLDNVLRDVYSDSIPYHPSPYEATPEEATSGVRKMREEQRAFEVQPISMTLPPNLWQALISAFYRR